MISKKVLIEFFKISPTPSLVILPDAPKYTIVEVNDAYLEATNTSRNDLVNKGIFEAFPSDSSDNTADGIKNLSKSLNLVIKHKKKNTMGTQKYDIPIRGTSQFLVKYWEPENIPLMDNEGELLYIVHTVIDVTKSTLALKKLEESKITVEKNKQVIAQTEVISKLGRWELNLESGLLFWSDNCYIMLGYQPQEFEITFEKMQQLIHSEDRDRVLEHFKKEVEKKEDYNVELRFVKKDATIIDVISRGIFIISKKKKTEKLVGVLQDITDIKKAEKKVKKAQRQLLDRQFFIETALENLPLGIAVNRIEDSKATLMNKKFSEIYGWPKEVLLDIPTFFKNVYPDEAYRNEITKKILSDIKSGEKERMYWDEVEITTQSGEKRIVNAMNIPVFEQNLMISTVVDVTDKIKAIKSIKESNERYEYVTKATFDAIWDWDLVTDNLYWGEGFEKIFGYKSSPKSNSFSWSKNIHPDDVYKVSESLYRTIAGTESNWTEEYQYKKLDGDYAYVIDKGIIIRDENGMAIRMIGAMQDITKQNEKERQLKLLETVIINTNDAVVIKEAKPSSVEGRKVLFVNDSFTRMSGYTAEEIIGKTHKLLQGQNSDPKELEKFYAALDEQKPTEITVVNYRKNGEEYWAQLSLNPVLNSKGEHTHWVSIERDVTDRKIQEKNLSEISQKLQNTLESIRDGFYTMDNNWNITYWNDVSEKVTGKKRDDVLGKNFWKIFNQDASEQSFIEFHRAKAENKSTHFELVSKFNGNWYEVSAFPSVSGLTVYYKDINQRKESEVKLKEINRDLQQHVKELAISNQELEQFAYVASHDLQEPLRMITSFLTQIEKKYEALLDEKGKKYIFFAVDGAKRMRQIILDLLDFSKVGKKEDKLELVNFNAIVEEITVLYRKQIEEKKATIKYGHLPTLSTYASPIKQVFQNLISNSLKYAKSNELPVISIGCQETEEDWEFTIEDNGIGIDPEYFSKIFIIFQRLHNKDEYTGTGMGLAIAKKIIDTIGGEIWVTSTEGKGSTFHFTIPINKT